MKVTHLELRRSRAVVTDIYNKKRHDLCSSTGVISVIDKWASGASSTRRRREKYLKRRRVLVEKKNRGIHIKERTMTYGFDWTEQNE